MLASSGRNGIWRFSTLAAICLISSRCCVSQTLPIRETAPHTVKSAETVRAAFQPWLRAIETIFSKTKDDDVRSYVQALGNAALMVPSGEGGPAALAQRILAPPPDTTRPWIGVIIIDSHKDLPAGRWRQLASASDFAAEYHDDTNTTISVRTYRRYVSYAGFCLYMKCDTGGKPDSLAQQQNLGCVKRLMATKRSSESSPLLASGLREIAEGRTPSH